MKTHKTLLRFPYGLFITLSGLLITFSSVQSASLSNIDPLELESRESIDIAKQTVNQKRARSGQVTKNIAYLLIVSDHNSQATPRVTFCKEFSLPSLDSTGKSEVGFQDEEAKATLKGTSENKDEGRFIRFEFSIKIPSESLPAGAPEMLSERHTNTSIQIAPGEIISFGSMSSSSTDRDTGETTTGTSHFILYCP